jgi:hypothetical protein
MNTDLAEQLPTSAMPPPPFGEPFEGGFYAGRLTIDGKNYALVVSPKPEGETRAPWKKEWTATPGTSSINDGFANTAAMNDANHPAAQFCRSLTISGFTDWYLPSRDELEILYRNLKPTGDENYTYASRLGWYEVDPGKYNGVDENGNGHNASSQPAGAAYSDSDPAQTLSPFFRIGGAQAFEPRWYWSSTEFDPGGAGGQGFVDGLQYVGGKAYAHFVRAVRKVLI